MEEISLRQQPLGTQNVILCLWMVYHHRQPTQTAAAQEEIVMWQTQQLQLGKVREEVHAGSQRVLWPSLEHFIPITVVTGSAHDVLSYLSLPISQCL